MNVPVHRFVVHKASLKIHVPVSKISWPSDYKHFVAMNVLFVPSFRTFYFTCFRKRELAVAGRPHNLLVPAMDRYFTGLGFSKLTKQTQYQRFFAERILKLVMENKTINYKVGS